MVWTRKDDIVSERVINSSPGTLILFHGLLDFLGINVVSEQDVAVEASSSKKKLSPNYAEGFPCYYPNIGIIIRQ